ncbi:MAG: hypothetical protein J6X92_07640 [Bacteroidales bacterium]|nr:hypothetical protein [Bacteroidales bacterium]
MDKDFNFDQIGNKMPYNVPEGFFDQLEENVLAEIKAEKLEIQQTKQKSNAIRKTFCVIFSAAAAFALFFVVTKIILEYGEEPIVSILSSWPSIISVPKIRLT